jgi:hypothetical protein
VPALAEEADGRTPLDASFLGLVTKAHEAMVDSLMKRIQHGAWPGKARLARYGTVLCNLSATTGVSSELCR